MAVNTTISALPQPFAINGDMEIPINNGGVTMKIKLSDVIAYFLSSVASAESPSPGWFYNTPPNFAVASFRWAFASGFTALPSPPNVPVPSLNLSNFNNLSVQLFKAQVVGGFIGAGGATTLNFTKPRNFAAKSFLGAFNGAFYQ